MAQTNHIEKVAIVGATGRLGSTFVSDLLKTGNHTITALTRSESKGTLPKGVKTAPVDYDDEQSLISALRGHQILIITLSVRAPPDLHSKIVHAAAKANVPYIMPNVYGFDITNPSLSSEDGYAAASRKTCLEIESLGPAYIAMTCGFWYEWSLAIGEQWFGFDIKKRTVTFFDDGTTKINTSTWAQCGRALAKLLSLPESGASPSVAQWKNKPFRISSFRVSQRDMLDSLNRVIGTSDKDWTITHESSAKRVEDGKAELQKGMMTGFAKSLYSRMFFPNGDGDYESSAGLDNEVVGLPKEELDEATRRTVEMVESGWNPFAQ